ncbi:hypothetical protein SDC9_144229 [bioreactor metagenome]|uniref:Uncharacterized protein n=1 Tax=bioreactor metagenome TaxID=1076179 RepID=A0A645E682_9ZZZZ
MLLSLVACGEKIDPPDKVVGNALTDIKSSDFETATKYFDTNPEETLDAAEAIRNSEIAMIPKTDYEQVRNILSGIDALIKNGAIAQQE